MRAVLLLAMERYDQNKDGKLDENEKKAIRASVL